MRCSLGRTLHAHACCSTGACVVQLGHMRVQPERMGYSLGHVKGGGVGHLLEGGGKQLALRRERGDGVGLYLVRDGLGGLLAEGGGGLLG